MCGLIAGLFVYWAVTDPRGRYGYLLFAVLALGFALRGWQERRSVPGQAAGLD